MQNILHSRAWQLSTSLALLVMILGVLPPAAQGQSSDDCLKCHGNPGLQVERDGRVISLYVDPEALADSLHPFDCTDCHTEYSGVTEYPHEESQERVDCTMCHDDSTPAIAAYFESTHGQRVQAGDPHAPLCQDCHGNHSIRPLSERGSAVSPFNIPRMCAQCHAAGTDAERTHDLPEEEVYDRYKDSIHGEGLFRQGLVVTAVCTSCHTAHHVLPHDDPRSSIHKDNVVATCMQCHGLIEEVHRKIVAGELWEAEGAVPICVECHSPHEITTVIYDPTQRNMDCLRCHGKRDLVASSDGRSLFVDEDLFSRSIHNRHAVTCAQCHSEVQPSQIRSCETVTTRVDCAVCHEEAVSAYDRGIHGKLHGSGDPNAPYCTDCHGKHQILEHQLPEEASSMLTMLVRESPTFKRNIPELCARCHRDGATAAVRYLGQEDHIVSKYTMSIHGKGLSESGLVVTATCTDCHTAHRELPHDDPLSSINDENLASTCGQCHDGIHELYERSIHSRTGNPDYVQLRGEAPLPHCNDCHTSHTVARTDVSDFKLGIMDQCGKCHREVTETYFETYHGKASALGDTARAKCQDCHGAHDILDPTNPRSRLHRDNIVATCGKCHPGSHRRFAGYLTHATHHDQHRYPALFYTFWAMTSLLVGVFVFFGIHTIAWLPRSWRLRKEHREARAQVDPSAPQYRRFNNLQRGLHLTVILSFFGLAITGLTIKFSYTEWAQGLSQAMGGVQTAGWVHRFCAVVTFGYFAIHLRELWRRWRQSGKGLLRWMFGPDSMIPNWNDAREFGQTIKWFLGLGKRPHYGNWTYWEKFDYFAVFWGIAVIGSTGLCLWFPEFFTRFLPGWAINVATIIHSDEALLATGFIFTIHFFNTHCRPEKFPLDPVIFTGRMPVEELKVDKPRLYEELVASGKLEESLAPAPSSALMQLAKIFGFTAVSVGVILIILTIYAMIFVYR